MTADKTRVAGLDPERLHQVLSTIRRIRDGVPVPPLDRAAIIADVALVLFDHREGGYHPNFQYINDLASQPLSRIEATTLLAAACGSTDGVEPPRALVRRLHEDLGADATRSVNATMSAQDLAEVNGWDLADYFVEVSSVWEILDSTELTARERREVFDDVAKTPAAADALRTGLITEVSMLQSMLRPARSPQAAHRPVR